MPKANSRFTQSDVAKLLKAGRSAGYTCVTVDVLAGDGGMRATYNMEAPGQGQHKGPADDGFREMNDDERAIWQEYNDMSAYERPAMDALFERRGQDVAADVIKRVGPITQRGLRARGYVSLQVEGEKVVSWRLTAKGEAFCKQVKALPGIF